MARSCRSLDHGASAWRAKSRLIRANSNERGYTTGALGGRFPDRYPCGAFLVVAPPKARKPVDDDHLERCLTSLSESSLKRIFSSIVFGVPTQALWGLAFVIFAALLFNRHRFGVHVKIVGDSPDSTREMGIDVDWVRVKTFIFVGKGAAFAGIFSTLINFTWWPTAGEGYLLPVLASVFVGGTPTWGGVGTVAGGAIGALIVSFIQTGVVGAGSPASTSSSSMASSSFSP
jgi:ribose/xylose/arabinose/galactoside ABC-type transport system permease subunit